jgi:hypothetical protein
MTKSQKTMPILLNREIKWYPIIENEGLSSIFRCKRDLTSKKS